MFSALKPVLIVLLVAYVIVMAASIGLCPQADHPFFHNGNVFLTVAAICFVIQLRWMYKKPKYGALQMLANGDPERDKKIRSISIFMALLCIFVAITAYVCALDSHTHLFAARALMYQSAFAATFGLYFLVMIGWGPVIAWKHDSHYFSDLS